MTVAEHRDRALREYGLRGTGAEDGQFTHPQMREIISQAATWLVKESKCLQARRTGDVVAGQDFVELEPDVFDFAPDRAVVYHGGQWQPLTFHAPEYLAATYGLLENASQGLPHSCWGALSETGQRRLHLFPTPNYSQTAGVRLQAFIDAPRLTDDGQTPALPATEDDALLPVILWRLAVTDRARGRQDAPVEYYFAEARRAALDLRQRTQRHRNPGTRRVRSDRASYRID